MYSVRNSVSSSLIDAVKDVSRLQSPARLQLPSQTMEAYLRDNDSERSKTKNHDARAIKKLKTETPGGYTITRSVAERMCDNRDAKYSRDGYREAQKETDEFVAEMAEYVHACAAKEMQKDNPELAAIKESGPVPDIHTAAKNINFADNLLSMYQLSHLEFLLNPNQCRSALYQYKHLVEDAVYEQLETFIDKTYCSAGEDCYYKTVYFKNVGRPGPVAMCSTMSTLMNDCMFTATNDSDKTEYMNLLYEFVMNISGIETTSAISQRSRFCIVCLIVNNSAREFSKNGGLDYRECPDVRNSHQMYLLNIQSYPGVYHYKHHRHTDSTVNVDGCEKYAIDANSLYNYKIEYDEYVGCYVCNKIK